MARRPRRVSKDTIKAKADGLAEVSSANKSMPDNLTLIYALADPVTLEIKYVGQTTRPARRKWLHRSLSNNRSGRLVCRWCTSLIEAGTPPTMFELEHAADGNEAERRWIKLFADTGASLLNMNEGGQAMEQCQRSPVANVKGRGLGPLQRVRISLAVAPKMLERHGHAEVAAAMRKKNAEVEAALSRLAKRMGSRAAAHAYVNSELRRRHPAWFRND